jgi:hypothetical protein
MTWADTTAGIYKMRNGANSAWISLWELDGTFIATDVSLSAGTAGAPSLYFTGDTNTGIYSPGADQVAISTAGSARLFIDSAGKIAIGATSAATQFAIQNSTTSLGVETDTTSGFASGPTIRGYYRASSAYSALGLTGSTVVFGINDVEKMRLDSSGRLGIGTSTFSYLANKLVIDKGSTANDGITIVSSSTSNACIWFADGTTGSEAYRGGIDYNHSTDKMQIYTSAQGNITIDSSGRLGIGTSNPTELLHVVGGSILSTNGFVRTAGSNANAVTTRGFRQTIDGTELLAIYHDNNGAVFNVNASERARLTSDGKFLVGTSTGSAKLEVLSNSTDTSFSTPYVNYAAVLRNDDQTNNNYSGLSFNTKSSIGGDTTVACIAAQCSNHTSGSVAGTLGFFTTGSTLAERFRIGSAGQLGIGGATYGTSGQVLTSGGASAAPTWASVSGLGVGQTWQNVTASRAFGTTYTNSTGKPIEVVIAFAYPGAGAAGQFTVGGVLITFGQVNSAYIQLASGSAIVPPGATYVFSTNTTINQWLELR